MTTLETAKKITTYDMDKCPNGFLIELFKRGNCTTVYLSCCAPKSFKGYHMHVLHEANYVCIKGKLKIIMYQGDRREEVILDSATPTRLNIPTHVPTALCNDYDEEAWIVNIPTPAYNPDLKNEQVDYTEEECHAGCHLDWKTHGYYN